MLPVPPSSAKCTPTWSSVRRKSWLHPISKDFLTSSLSRNHVLGDNGRNENKPVLLHNHSVNSQVQPIRMLSIKTPKTHENQYRLILCKPPMPKEEFLLPANTVLSNTRIPKNKRKLKPSNDIQLLRSSVQLPALPHENENLNRLLPLNEIKSFARSVSKIEKMKQNSVKLNFLKSHLLLNNYELSKPNVFHLLNLNKNLSKTKQQFGRLLQLPHLQWSDNKHVDPGRNKQRENPNKTPFSSSRRSLDSNCHSSAYKPNPEDNTLPIATYPIISEQFNEDQLTLNDISWGVDTTKDNIMKSKRPSTTQRNSNSPVHKNDFGVQFNFVDYGGPKTEIGLHTPFNLENSTCPPYFIEQLLQNDITHFTKQFLSVHTTDLIDWSDEEKDDSGGDNNNNPSELHIPSAHLHPDSSNPVKQNNENTTEYDNSQSDIRPIVDKTGNDNTNNEGPPIINTQLQTTSPNSNQFIADPITAKTLAYSYNIDNHKENIQLPMFNDLYNKPASNYFPVDVLKALSEIDNRLNVIDQVSVQLEQDHKRNQELLETIIELNKGQNKTAVSAHLNDSKEAIVNPVQQSQLLIPSESSPKVDQIDNVKPSVNETKHPDMKISSHNFSNLSTSKTTKSPRLTPRSRSTSGHYSEEREKARKERREVSITRRCDEAKKFVDEILLDSHLPVQSSPILHPKLSIARTSSAPVSRGRGQGRVRGAPRLSTSRASSKNYNVLTSPKPPTPARSVSSLRGGVRARGVRNVPADRRVPAAALQKSSMMDKPQSSSPKQSNYEDDLQTTILSDWSLESDVKRILYGDEDVRFLSSSKVQHFGDDVNSNQDYQVPQSPHSVPETDLLTEVGGVPSTSFIDWDEIDELIGAV
ncbi:unnamed protein product [Trichobilharzia szidati]|nr:unnamed protein product [Trichobilharzia szidati]